MRLEAATNTVLANAASEYDKLVVLAMIAGYDAKWIATANEYETISVEEEFCLPIYNPNTNYKVRAVVHAGKRDGLVKHNGNAWLLEHKTTSESIDEPDADYWRRLTIDSQINGYVLSLWQEGVQVDGTIYDVIRKPTIRAKKITKEGMKEIFNSGTYCGVPVTRETVSDIYNGTIESETDELFACRVRADCIEFPDKYFQRREIFRTRQELEKHAVELYQIARQIKQAKTEDSHYKNASACTMYGQTCEYLPLCCGNDTIDSDSWRKRESQNSELALPEGDDDVITNSRIKTFLACRQKHHLRYNLLVERANRPANAALTFGTLFHLALEAWWKPQGGHDEQRDS